MLPPYAPPAEAIVLKVNPETKEFSSDAQRSPDEPWKLGF
jgi:hypothetical protein